MSTVASHHLNVPLAAKSRGEQHHRWLALDPIVVLPPLTVLHLLVHAPQAWYLSVVLVPLFALGLIFRPWLRSAPFWYVTAALLGTTVYFNWETTDNHKYLFVYWCLALCCTFSLPRDQWRGTLAQTSRLLIALCMVLATAWKALTPEYMDGRFFSFELLVDERFASFTHWMTGVSLDSLATNRELRDLMLHGHLTGTTVNSVELAGWNQVAWLSGFLTWWTVLIEGALGLLFLVPVSRAGNYARWISLTRNTLLILFAVTTYSVAPVRGFGWMLMLLGLAQCIDTGIDSRDRRFRWGYLAALLLIQAYTIPLGQIISLLSSAA
jgi:hypothetical protein